MQTRPAYLFSVDNGSRRGGDFNRQKDGVKWGSQGAAVLVLPDSVLLSSDIFVNSNPHFLQKLLRQDEHERFELLHRLVHEGRDRDWRPYQTIHRGFFFSEESPQRHCHQVVAGGVLTFASSDRSLMRLGRIKAATSLVGVAHDMRMAVHEEHVRYMNQLSVRPQNRRGLVTV